MNMKRLFLGSMLALAGCAVRAVAPDAARGALVVSSAAARPTIDGSASTFTGAVRVTPLIDPEPGTRSGAASVAFAAGARSAWHSHPAGQTLLVTEGTGWVQAWGGEKRVINAGDVVWTPPGVKHWHGATSSSAMTHIAIQHSAEGKVVEWLEHVSDEDYAR